MLKHGGTAHWPEMERIVVGLGMAARSEGHCYGITGPVGIGKSHLLGGLERAADSLGFKVIRGFGAPGAGLGSLFLALLPPQANPSIEQLPLTVLDRLMVLSSYSPVLFTLEDFHLVDTAAISALIFLTRNIVHSPVMIVLTYDDEMLDTASGEVQPLRDGVRILMREGLFDEVRLSKLDRLSLKYVLDEEFGGPLDDALVNIMWRRSEGNPMVAIEEVRLLIQSRQAEKVGGLWKAVEPLQLDLPEDYSAFIRSRVDLLTVEDRGALTIASMVGREFDPKMIALLQGKDLLDVLEQLDRIVREHRLLEEEDEGYRFSVEAVRSALLEDVPLPLTRDVHERIGRILECGKVRDAPFNDMSDHYYLAERADKCVCFSLLAGQKSLEEGDNQKAVEHYQKVIDATQDGGYNEERLFSMEGIADAEMVLGKAEKARYWYHALLNCTLPPATRERIQRKLR